MHATGRTLLITVILLAVSTNGLAATIPVSGACTLADAVRAANDDAPHGGCPAGSGADTLVLSADVVLTAVAESYVGDNGLPVVRSDITVEGGGFTIRRDDTAPEFRIFAVAPGGSLTLHELTLTNGNARGLFVVGSGGAIHNVDGGTLRLEDVVIAGNAAEYYGGGIYTESPTTILRSVVRENVARFAGGIQTENFTPLEIADTTIADNHAIEAGGGLHSQFSLIELVRTTLSGNSADRCGGLVVAEGSALLRNSTLSGNSGDAFGGGICVSFAQLELEHVSVIANTSPVGAALWLDDFPDRDAFATVVRSILAGNPGGAECFGTTLTDDGDNFADDASCGAGFAPIVAGVDFEHVLRANGGPTRTHALFADSVAIDAAGDCGLATDQRGVPRSDGSCDSGAYEYHEPLLVTMESYSATLNGDGVRVRWATAAETDTVGFRVLREEGGGRDKRLVAAGPFVHAAGNGAVGASYEVLDDSRGARNARRYFIEDLDLFGRTTRHGPIDVVVAPGARVEPAREGGGETGSH